MSAVGIIKNHPFFSFWPDDAIERLLAIAESRSLKKDVHIYVENEPSRGIFFLQSGQVSFRQSTSDGSLTQSNGIEAPNLFGEESLFGEQTRNHTAYTITDCELLYFDSNEVEKTLSSVGDIVQAEIYKNYSKHLVRTLRKLENDYTKLHHMLWSKALVVEKN